MLRNRKFKLLLMMIKADRFSLKPYVMQSCFLLIIVDDFDSSWRSEVRST